MVWEPVSFDVSFSHGFGMVAALVQRVQHSMTETKRRRKKQPVPGYTETDPVNDGSLGLRGLGLAFSKS